MINEIPLTCPHCGERAAKPVEWLQQNTFFTCDRCQVSVMINKDLCTEVLVKLELQERR